MNIEQEPKREEKHIILMEALKYIQKEIRALDCLRARIAGQNLGAEEDNSGQEEFIPSLGFVLENISTEIYKEGESIQKIRHKLEKLLF